MATPALLTIHDAYVTFGGKPLFDGLAFNIHQGDRISLVGKNGAGKTTLMHLITGVRELDGGKRWLEPGTTIGYLKQDIAFNPKETVHDFIRSGLQPERQTEEYLYMVDMVMEPFELNPQQQMRHLSGGQLRRAALAHALVEDPDILLLDEPTNHLDLSAIEWLEDYLKNWRGTLLCVSHDRTFLANISNKIFWLDRGQIKTCPKGFAHFEEWSTMLLEQEARELSRRERILSEEIEWASRGVKARRKRNQKRLENVALAREKLKSDKSAYRKVTKRIELPPLTGPQSSRIVAEFYRVSKAYQDLTILDQMSIRIMREDRIGILGKNGSGKTTFLKLLTGEIAPDQGKVKRAKTLEFSYFDQKRADLKPHKSLRENLCPTGGDYVDVRGKPRHVCGYLKDFLFDPKQADDLVSTLSGGQKNRLMLAKTLANPGSFLILDEPTNDLDMDTLDMLEDILSAYTGTLVIVSHDRDFLDQTVTTTLAFEGEGNIEYCIGGYSDYIASKKKTTSKNSADKPAKTTSTESTKSKAQEAANAPQKLSYKLEYELKQLPETITNLEEELTQLKQTLADAELYTKDPQQFDAATKRYAVAQKQLHQAEERWLELEALKTGEAS